jgi:multimeric flavodoxin WrbA
MNIVVFSASTNEPSNSDYLADRFIEGMHSGAGVSAAGGLPAQITKFYLKDLHIDHFHVGHYATGADQSEDFRRVQSLMETAHGFVIATPVWNFGVPAHLKNLIDRMGSFALDETRSRGTLRGKPFYCIFTGGAPFPAWQGMMRKTSSFVPEGLKYFDASYIGHHFEGKCTAGSGKFGLVVDKRPDAIEAVKRKGREFAKVVAEYEQTGKAPVKQRAVARIMKFGEAVLKKVS